MDENIDKIETFLKTIYDQSNTEIEFKYDNVINKYEFERLKKYYDLKLTEQNLEKSVSENSLDIKLYIKEDYRITVKSKEGIISFCKYNSIEDLRKNLNDFKKVEAFNEKHLEVVELRSDRQYENICDLKLKKKKEFKKSLEDLNKYKGNIKGYNSFRLKERNSFKFKYNENANKAEKNPEDNKNLSKFLITNDDNNWIFRVDITKVYEKYKKKGYFDDFMSSKIKDNPPKYEYEIEFNLDKLSRKCNNDNKKIAELSNQFLTTFYLESLKKMNNYPVFSLKNMNEIEQKYKKLVKKIFIDRFNSKILQPILQDFDEGQVIEENIYDILPFRKKSSTIKKYKKDFGYAPSKMTIEKIVYEKDEDEKITNIKYQVKNDFGGSIEEIDEEDIDGISYGFWLNPNLVSLQIENLKDILNSKDLKNDKEKKIEYCVTDKADGYTALLYVVNKKGYLISKTKNNFNIRETGLEFEFLKEEEECIFNGEFLEKDKDGNNFNKYAIFDCYYYLNEDICYKDLISNENEDTRLGLVKKFIRLINSNVVYKKNQKSDEKIQIFLKQFIIVDDKKPGESANEIWKSEYEYQLDGMIYTPANTPVKYQPDKNNSEYLFNLSLWTKNYKWKPLKETSIDLKIKKIKDDDDNYVYEFINGKKYVRVLLYFYSRKDHYVFPTGQSLKNKFNIRDKRLNQIKNKIFSRENTSFPNQKTWLIELKKWKNNDNKIYDDEYQEVSDSSIAEFYYYEEMINSENPFNLKTPNSNYIEYDYKKRLPSVFFRIKRVRNDKSNANNIDTVISNWNIINNPIKLDDITNNNWFSLGNKNYFKSSNKIVKDMEQETGIDLMKKFHLSVKLYLFNYIFEENKSRSVSILDLASGQFGIMHLLNECKNKNKTNIINLIGIDIDEIAIKEAFRRFIQFRKDGISGFFTYFYQKDLTNQLSTKELNILKLHFDNKESNKLRGGYSCSERYNKDSPPYILNHPQRPCIKNTTSTFDVVSIMFAIHYFYNEKAELHENFIYNLNKLTHTGSYLIGIAYDKTKVDELIENSDEQNSIKNDNDLKIGYKSSYNDDNSDPYWSIKYSEEDAVTIVNKIEVKMPSFEKKETEYLVDFKKLESSLQTDTMVWKKLKISNIIDLKDDIKSVLNKKYKKSNYLDYINNFESGSEGEIISKLNNLFIFQREK